MNALQQVKCALMLSGISADNAFLQGEKICLTFTQPLEREKLLDCLAAAQVPFDNVSPVIKLPNKKDYLFFTVDNGKEKD